MIEKILNAILCFIKKSIGYLITATIFFSVGGSREGLEQAGGWQDECAFLSQMTISSVVVRGENRNSAPSALSPTSWMCFQLLADMCACQKIFGFQVVNCSNIIRQQTMIIIILLSDYSLEMPFLTFSPSVCVHQLSQ